MFMCVGGGRSERRCDSSPSGDTDWQYLSYSLQLRAGSAVGRWTCDLQVAGSIPGRWLSRNIGQLSLASFPGR